MFLFPRTWTHFPLLVVFLFFILQSTAYICLLYKLLLISTQLKAQLKTPTCVGRRFQPRRGPPRSCSSSFILPLSFLRRHGTIGLFGVTGSDLGAGLGAIPGLQGNPNSTSWEKWKADTKTFVTSPGVEIGKTCCFFLGWFHVRFFSGIFMVGKAGVTQHLPVRH